MHILFVHPNYPAQFGQIARALVASHGFRCTFVSRHPPGIEDGIERLQYHLRGGAGPQTHPFSRSIEDAVWRSHAVLEALQSRPDIQPDLIVGQSGYLNVCILKDLYQCPVVNYFDQYFHLNSPDPGYRADLMQLTEHRLPTLMRNCLLLLDLEYCDLGYSPSLWQWNLLPPANRSKIRVIFDGLDQSLWYPQVGIRRSLNGETFADDQKVITYVSRGLESIRGFDLFMKAANIVCRRRTDVTFVVVGSDQSHYSPDGMITGGVSFRQWVLSQDTYDLSRFYFTGTLPATQLAELFSFTDLHVYLTIPFVLSWSLLNALACGAPVLASNTAPVQEVIEPGVTGLLTDLYDTQAMADRMCEVLDCPKDYRHLGQNGADLIRRKYSLEACLPQMLSLYSDAQASKQSSFVPR
jgi:glycosyltransferase involved in cell wall biosynthesis